MGKRTEQQLEKTIAVATDMLEGERGLNYVYKDNPKLLPVRRDYWESMRVQAQEQLYNLRNGDATCLTSTKE